MRAGSATGAPMVLIALLVLALAGAAPASASAARLPAAAAGTSIHALTAAMPDRSGDEDRTRQQRLKKRRLAAPRVVTIPAQAKQARPAAGFITIAAVHGPDADDGGRQPPGPADAPRRLAPPERQSPPGHAPPRA